MKNMLGLLTPRQHRRNYFNMKKKLLKSLSPLASISAKKALLKANKKRNRRKALYPFGFEYAKERR